MPNDEFKLLLQSIIDDLKSARLDIGNMKRDNFTRADGKEMQTEMNEHFDKLNDKVDDHTDQLKDLKVGEGLNTNFRKGWIGATKYVLGAAFVAGLGILATIIPSMINHSNSGASVASPPPHVSQHLHIPEVK